MPARIDSSCAPKPKPWHISPSAPLSTASDISPVMAGPALHPISAAIANIPNSRMLPPASRLDARDYADGLMTLTVRPHSAHAASDIALIGIRATVK